MGEISCVVIGTLPSSDLHYSLAVLSTLPDNPGDSRFWTVSPGLQIRVWNLPDNHPSFPFLVDSTFWQWNFKYFALFELFYCWHRTFPHKHQYAIVIEAIMWLVGSKPIRSNVTIPTTSFLRIFFFFFKWLHVPCILISSIVPSLSILNIWKHGGLTALHWWLVFFLISHQKVTYLI